MKEKVVIRNLAEVKEILDKVGITYWLDSGTLLGAVRDGKIIEWDVDVDLGTWYSNINKIISAFPLFKERGFHVIIRRRYGFMTIAKDCNVDVDLFRRTDYHAWRFFRAYTKKIENLLGWWMTVLENLETYTRPEGKKLARKSELFLAPLPLKLRHLMTDVTWFIIDRCDCIIPWTIPKHFFEKLSTIQFYGMKFNIPSKVDNYLEYRYGSGWETPNKNWNTIKDDGAVNPNFMCMRENVNSC